MSGTIRPAPDALAENLRAIMLIVISMALFAVEDSFIKLASRQVGTGQIMLVLGAIGGTLFVAYGLSQGHRLPLRRLVEPALLTRNLAEVVGTAGFVTALTLIPLSTASAILQAAPLVVTFGAALVLRESVGWRRWLAISIGFAGVIIILRPGLAGFDANALFAVIGVIGLAVRDVATRKLPRDLPTSLVSGSAYLILTIPAILLMSVTGGWKPVSGDTAFYLGCSALIGVGGYYAVTAAMRIGEISVVAPFRYTRLVFAMIIGIIVFGERPDLLTYVGSAIVIATGLYTFYRERLRARDRP